MPSPGVSIVDKHENVQYVFESVDEIRARVRDRYLQDDEVRWLCRAMREAEHIMYAMGVKIQPCKYLKKSCTAPIVAQRDTT
jgi:hypothetical protein